jgi:hypothetical protein
MFRNREDVRVARSIIRQLVEEELLAQKIQVNSSRGQTRKEGPNQR